MIADCCCSPWYHFYPSPATHPQPQSHLLQLYFAVFQKTNIKCIQLLLMLRQFNTESNATITRVTRSSIVLLLNMWSCSDQSINSVTYMSPDSADSHMKNLIFCTIMMFWALMSIIHRYLWYHHTINRLLTTSTLFQLKRIWWFSSRHFLCWLQLEFWIITDVEALKIKQF